MKSQTILLLVVLIHAKESASDQSSFDHCEDENVVDLNNICYVTGTIPMNFQEARLHCVSNFLAGDLATLLEGKHAQTVRQYFSWQVLNLLEKYEKPESKLHLDEGKAENKSPALETKNDSKTPEKEAGRPKDGVTAVLQEASDVTKPVYLAESLVSATTASPCPENRTEGQTKAERDESSKTDSKTRNDTRCKVKSAVSKREIPMNDSQDNVPKAKYDILKEKPEEENSTETSRLRRLLHHLRETGLWVGAYRGDRTIEEIVALAPISHGNALFTWLRLSSIFLLPSDEDEDCVYAQPEDGYKLHASRCSKLRLPFCQLHSCPTRRCLNGGRCRNGTCVCLDSFRGNHCEVLTETLQQMAIVQDPVMVPNRLESSSRMDPGLRNLLIALFITVVGSLIIALVFSKDRLRRMVRGRGSDTLQEEEGDVEMTMESMPLGMGSVNIPRRAPSKASPSKPQVTGANSTANASSAAKHDPTTEVAMPAALVDGIYSSSVDPVGEVALIDIKDIDIDIAVSAAAAAVDETCAAEFVEVDAETSFLVSGTTSAKGDN